MDTPMRNIEMEALRSEPALDGYFERVEGQRQGAQDQIEIRRGADIAFKCKENKNPAILSILVSRLKNYKPGELADARTTEKNKSYEKRFNISPTDRANLYFFTVESWELLDKKRLNCVYSFGDESCYSVTSKNQSKIHLE
jgi:hypothetical protein